MNSTTHPTSDHPMDNITQHVTEGAAGIATKASVGTGISAMIIGGLGLQEWLMIVGIMTTIGTFAVNWYYQRARTIAIVKPNEQCKSKDDCKFPDEK